MHLIALFLTLFLSLSHNSPHINILCAKRHHMFLSFAVFFSKKKNIKKSLAATEREREESTKENSIGRMAFRKNFNRFCQIRQMLSQ
jgi:hypothetical protein